MVVKIEEEVLRTVLCDTIVAAFKRHIPYMVGFTVEGSLDVSLTTEEKFQFAVKETGEGTAKYRRKSKTRNENVTPSIKSQVAQPASKRKRGRPCKVRIIEPDPDSSDAGGGNDFDDDKSSMATNFPNLSQVCEEAVPVGSNIQTIKQELLTEDNADGHDVMSLPEGASTTDIADVSVNTSDSPRLPSKPTTRSMQNSLAKTSCVESPNTEHAKEREIQSLARSTRLEHKQNQGGKLKQDAVVSHTEEKLNKKAADPTGNEEAPEPKRKRGRPPKFTRCPSCKEIHASVKEMQEHLATSHGDGLKVQKNGKEVRIRVNKFKCHLCPRDFYKRTRLEAHINSHLGKRPHACDQCDRAYNSEWGLKSHQRMHTGIGIVICDICGRQCMTESALCIHRLSHTGEKPYSCGMCNKRYRTKGMRDDHERTHGGEYNFECDRCDKKFQNKRSLKSHSASHSNVTYPCSVCGKCLKSPYSRKLHELAHTGQKLHQCVICGDRFSQPGALRNHEKRHTGEKPYKCSYCSKGFQVNNDLVVHERIHTGEKPYTCEVCGRSYRVMNTYKKHFRTHTGEKPYKCLFCTKCFRTRDGRVLHQRTHTGEKPHACDICSQKFTQRQHVKRHKWTIHRVGPFRKSYLNVGQKVNLSDITGSAMAQEVILKETSEGKVTLEYEDVTHYLVQVDAHMDDEAAEAGGKPAELANTGIN